MWKMRGNEESDKKERSRSLGRKKQLVIAAVAGSIILCAAFAALKFFSGEQAVGFEEMKERQIPKDITSEVVPEYKTLERALACMVDEDVYVVVTRGEKPTSGYGVSVDRMAVEEKDGKTNLIVYALFDDPQQETAISQIITYPLCIVKTDLEKLPDTIELRIQY